VADWDSGVDELRTTNVMSGIKPTEAVLTGTWVLQGGRVVGDEVCHRIQALVKSYLVKLRTDASGWDVLYRDPADGRLWELTYPEGSLQGGGPPQLRHVSHDEANRKYGVG